MKFPKTEIPMDTSCSSLGSKSHKCCSCDISCSHYKDTRTWVKVVAWFNIVLGAFCTAVLIWEVNVAVRKLAHSEFGIEFTSNQVEMENKIHDAKQYIIAGLVVKIGHLISYLAKAIMGMFLLNGVKKENPTVLKNWLIITFIFFLIEMVVITPILIYAEKFDYVAFLCWELPLWILTIVSLFVVFVLRDELQNYNIPSAMALPLPEKTPMSKLQHFSTTDFV